MSILTDRLNYFIDKRKERVSELARRSGIDRATLHQYLSDRRSLKNRAHLEALIAELHLSPQETEEIYQAYERVRIGEYRYGRRQAIASLLDSLQFVSDQPPEATPHLQETDRLEPDVFSDGKLNVRRKIYGVIRDAAAREQSLKLLIQPNASDLFEPLLLLWQSTRTAQVDHLICLEMDGGQDGCANLTLIQQVVRYSVGIPRYQPYYYYGSIQEHYGLMNLLPNLLMTDRYALLLSSDLNAAILLTQEEQLRFFHETFDKMKAKSRRLTRSFDGFNEALTYQLTELMQQLTPDSLGLYPGLFSIPFWDREIIHTYISKQLPDWEKMAEGYFAFAEYLNGFFSAQKLMSAEDVREFILTGALREYPSYLFSEPCSVDDRKTLVERAAQAIEDGWFHARLVPKEVYPTNYRWEIAVYRASFILFYHSDTQFRVFLFEEPDILDAAYDYIKSLSERPEILSTDETAAQLRQWVRQYLN